MLSTGKKSTVVMNRPFSNMHVATDLPMTALHQLRFILGVFILLSGALLCIYKVATSLNAF